MGLLGKNPCSSCEFKDRCEQPAILKSYVTSADEEGCPHYGFLKKQGNAQESWNAFQQEQQAELDAMNEETADNFDNSSTDTSTSVFDIDDNPFKAAFEEEERRQKERREQARQREYQTEGHAQETQKPEITRYEHLYNILHQIDLFDDYTICSPQCMIQVCLQKGEVNVLRRTPAAKINELGGDWQEWQTFKAPKLNFTRMYGSIHRIGASIYFKNGEDWYQLVNGLNLSLWSAKTEYDFERLEWRPIPHDKMVTALSLALHPLDSESNRAFKAIEDQEEAERILSEIVMKNAYGDLDTSRKDYVCLPDESPAVRQLRKELKKYEAENEKAEKEQKRQAMLEAMSLEEKEAFLQQEDDKKKKAQAKKEQERKKKELKKQQEEQEEQIRKKRLHIHQLIFWSIYLVSTIICFACADEWWHYLLIILGMIVLALGRGLVRLITD